MRRTNLYKGYGDLTQSKIPIIFDTTSIIGQPTGKILSLIILILWGHAGSAGVLREKEIADGIIRDVDPEEVLWLGDGGG